MGVNQRLSNTIRSLRMIKSLNLLREVLGILYVIGKKILLVDKYRVKLYEWLLTHYAKPNDLILDTHCGSASSLIACENLGFKYIASELDKDYYSQSLQRLKAHLAQGKLFQRVGRDEIRLEQPSMFA